MGCLILFSGLPFPQERIPPDYQIGPRDLIEITVFGAPEMNRKERVPETGRITFPLLGEVDVAGLTKVELEKKLTQLLGEKLLQNPQVTVSILEYQSKRGFVLGAIRTPGPYELQGRQTLLHAIAEAGGLLPEAGNEIIITRKLSEGTTNSLRISV